jgi:hypothetical protein
LQHIGLDRGGAPGLKGAEQALSLAAGGGH